jgi:hypothetical protein
MQNAATTPLTSTPTSQVSKTAVIIICVIAAAVCVAAILAVALSQYFRVKSNCKNQHKVMPAIEHLAQAQPHLRANAGDPGARPASSTLPAGVSRVSLSNYPVIDMFEGANLSAAAAADANVASALLGVPPQCIQGPWEVADSASPSPVFKAYFSEAESIGSDKTASSPPQRIATAVIFHAPGGGVRFPYFGHVVRGQLNRVVAWFNVGPKGHVDPRAQFAFEPHTHASIVHWSDARRRHVGIPDAATMS